MNQTVKKQYPTIDLFKFVASIMVVALHTLRFSGLHLDLILNAWLVYSVPFFFCASSFIFWKRNADIRKYILRLSKLYSIWFIIEIPFIYLRYFHNVIFEYAIINFTRNLIFQNTFYASWYLMASIEAMLVVYIISKYCNKMVLLIVTVICFCLSLLASMYNGLLYYFDFGHQINAILQFICASQSFILAIPYIVMGKYLAQNTNNQYLPKYTIYFFFLLLLISILEVLGTKSISSGFNASLSIIPIIFFITKFAINNDVQIKIQYLITIRKISILVYLIHCIIKLAYQSYCSIEPGFVLFFLTLFTTIIISYSVLKASENYSILKNLY